MSNCLNLSNSDLAAMSSVIIAICALAISIWVAYLAWKHNILSSRPLLQIEFSAVKAGPMGIFINNCGPGPALIQKIILIHEKTKYDLTNAEEIHKLLRCWCSEDSTVTNFHIAIIHGDEVVGSGKTLELIKLEASSNMASTAIQLKKAFKNAEIEIHYKSLYDKVYKAKYEDVIRSVT